MKKSTTLLINLLVTELRKEWAEETYGEVLFFPDNSRERDAKFLLWLLTRYGVEKVALAEAEKYELLKVLKEKQ